MSANDEILKAERDWLVALERRDLNTLDRVLAEDFTLTPWASAGEIITKREYLEEAKLARINKADVRGCATQVYGDMAIVKCHLHWMADYADMTWSAEFLITDVWVRFDDGWKAVTRHVSTVREPATQVVPSSEPAHSGQCS
jgi:ketosteroid isomerase-like protein